MLEETDIGAVQNVIRLAIMVSPTRQVDGVSREFFPIDSCNLVLFASMNKLGSISWTSHDSLTSVNEVRKVYSGSLKLF
jgi:hypothetical protein